MPAQRAESRHAVVDAGPDAADPFGRRRRDIVA
jgi:hypothetical protein